MTVLNKYFFLLVLVILSASFFYFGTYRNWPYKVEGDGKYYYQYLVSGISDGDLDFSNNYVTPKYPWMVMEIDHYNLREIVDPTTGKPVNYWTVGPAILWLPFYLAATLLGKGAMLLGFQVDLNPFGRYMQYATMSSAVFYALGALYLLYRIMRKFCSEGASKTSLWLILFMTPLFYYTIFEPSLSHVYDFFTFTVIMSLALQFKATKSTLFYTMFGAFCALHVLVRTQNIINISILFLFLALAMIRSGEIRRLSMPKTLACFAALLVGLVPIALINRYLYGSPFTIPQGEGFMRWDDPQIMSLLFSERNGLFSHHPIFLVGIIGSLLLLFRLQQNRLWLTCLLCIFIVQVYINSTVEDWWAGHSFGQRRLLFALPLCALGLGCILDRMQARFKKFTQVFTPLFVMTGTILWFYLTMIHVFIWDYNKPHNIYQWMFHYAPKILGEYYGFL